MPKAVLCLNYIHRVEDNPLFISCAREKLDIIPFVFFTDKQLSTLGAAEKLFLYHSLQELNKELDDKLCFLKSEQELDELISKEKPQSFLFSFNAESRINPDYEELEKDYPELDFIKFSANNIFDFDQIRNKSGTVFRVFTPFYKHCLTRTQEFIADPIKNQLSNNIKKHVNILDAQSRTGIEAYGLLGLKAKWNKNWQAKLLEYWNISTAGSNKLLKKFIDKHIEDYPKQRDYPAEPGTSKLSSYLHFGMMSPFRIWFDVEQAKAKAGETEAYNSFLRQLCWREFAQYILYHFPHSSHKNLNDKFDKFPWLKNEKQLEAWKKGMTGYPIVDAGMRELWETGWMHNRVRMIVGSFLIKDLFIHWREGAKWFEDTLFDADLANNSMGWQWVAGSGVDASPYFRIFNPMTQSEKFDKQAQYIRRWVPELKNLDDKWIHRPFEAPPMILEAAGVKLGDNYPEPLVNHDHARKEALAAFKTLK